MTYEGRGCQGTARNEAGFSTEKREDHEPARGEDHVKASLASAVRASMARCELGGGGGRF